MKCHVLQSWMVSLGLRPQASLYMPIAQLPIKNKYVSYREFFYDPKSSIFYKSLQIILDATEAVLAIYIVRSTVEYQRVY